MNCFRPGGLELTEKAALAADLKAGAQVLDVGCGLGTSLAYLAERFHIDPHGVDASADAVSHAGKDYILHADAESLPFSDGFFDAVFMECVLPLLPCPEKALNEARRVLSPGGSLALSALSGDCGAALTAQGRADFDALAAYLETLGFSVTLLSDESAALRQFLAEIIFRYDSIEAYTAEAERCLGGSVLSCGTPKRGTLYKLLVARLM